MCGRARSTKVCGRGFQGNLAGGPELAREMEGAWRAAADEPTTREPVAAIASPEALTRSLLKEVDFKKLDTESLDDAVKLLGARYQTEFQRFSLLEVKSAAILAGLLAILGFTFRGGIGELIASGSLLIPIAILGSIFFTRPYYFAPTSRSILTNLRDAASLHKDLQRRNVLAGSIETFCIAIEKDVAVNVRKAKRLNDALIAVSACALLFVGGFLWDYAHTSVPVKTSKQSGRVGVVTQAPPPVGQPKVRVLRP